MIHQNPLTLITPVKTTMRDKLTDILQKIRLDIEKGLCSDFEKPGTIHYCRLVILEASYNDDKNDSSKPINLVFSTDYDGNEDEHLAALSSVSASLIDKLYECCEGYPLEKDRTPESRKKYLGQWRVKAASFFAGAPGRSLKQVQQESALRNYIWEFLKEGSWKNKTAVEVHKAIRQNVYAKPGFEWAKQQVPVPKLKWMNFVLLGLILLLLLPITILLLLFVVGWILVLHFFYEKKDTPLGLTPSQIDENHVKELEEYEDIHNQNQFTQIITMKPGKVRLLTVNALMLYAKFRVHNEFVYGKLMGIPTIHFARWLLIDNNKRMLFFSNFDGSWQQYLGDFIDKSGWGLTAIFGNTENFPKARYLFWGGAYDEEHFLAWSRYYQIPTQVWYCAYPLLSIKNINNNTYIRHELLKDLNEEQAQQFLQRF